ncbi:MAG: sulfatase [Pirellulaceae bacterium]
MPQFGRFVLTLLLALSSAFTLWASPNVVLFYADDLGWADVACQGTAYLETPHIDRLATEGMRFTQAYAAAANCAPSRASLLTGCYPPRHGIFTVGNSDRGNAKNRQLVPVQNRTTLDGEFVTLGTLFHNAGYRTCVAGKWHVSPDPRRFGFDINFGGNHAGHPKSYFSPYHNPQLPDGPAGEHLPERLGRDVAHWISQNADGPFFVYLPFYSVHTPIQARPELAKKYQTKRSQWPAAPQTAAYAAMIESMDAAMGQVLDTLDRLQLTDNTMVIFTSDNGPHGAVSNADPLRGSKGMFYEGGIREPLIVRYPKIVQPNQVCEQVVHQVDLFPTLQELIGGKQVPQELDGVSLLPVLRGQPLAERDLYWHFPCYLEGGPKNIRGSKYAKHWRTTPCSVIRSGNWKLIEYFEDGQFELYNLARDPRESTNLFATNQVEAQRLKTSLREWQESVDAPIPKQRNPQFRRVVPDTATGTAIP